MISVHVNFDNNEKRSKNEPASVNVTGALSVPTDVQSVVDSAISQIATVVSKLGGDCRSNLSVTKENDGTISCMINVAQLAK